MTGTQASAQSEVSTSDAAKEMNEIKSDLVEEGRQICQSLGIAVQAEYDLDWRSNL